VRDGWIEGIAIGKQKPCGAEGSGFGSVSEFLISDPFVREGRVRWVHAICPSLECRLALGQMYHLRVHAQLLLCRLADAQPQADLAKKSTAWSSVVFPAAYIDSSARLSFEKYQRWYHRMATHAKHRGAGEGEKKVVQHFSRGMPAMRLAIVQLNLMLFWSDADDQIVISVASDPKYLARWSTPSSESCESWWERLRRSCVGCCRRRSDGGYERLASSDEEANDQDLETATASDSEEEDEDLDDEDAIRRMFRQHELAEKAKQSAQFEFTFGGLLTSLAEPHSVIRMGTHIQLMLRILLNRSMDYLDIAYMYKVAINHLRELLHSDAHIKDEQVIVKISAAKHELQTLLKSVTPFVENVIPMLRQLHEFDGEPHESETIAERLCRHHRFDMENNFKQFMQDSREQILLCESILGDYDRSAADQANSLLNFLTIITFLVMPTQILTGLYGMNFAHMPELRWEFGYHFFFGTAGVVTLLFALILVCWPRSRARR